ncbi:hypothetical protein [Dinoroseobacter sp. S375]|uniref:hypothetical protein n=1 Tax=Dinoroseobacter sp. S375 TaxID=3415136 RepID=UPI003C7B7782
MNHGLKAKTIKAILRKKVDEWLASIEDESLRKDCAKEVVVTGGCIASMLLGETVNDFDVYLRKKETVRKLAEYYCERFKAIKSAQGGVPYDVFVEDLKDTRGKDRVRLVVQSAGVASADAESDYKYFESRPDHEAGDYVSEAFDPLSEVADIVEPIKEELAEGTPYEPSFISSNAISLKGKVQIVVRFFGDPDEIHENYDFDHCKNYWEASTGKLTLRPEALEALLSKTLAYSGSLYPLCSVIRTRKFIERGWRINAGQYLKMSMQLSDLDLKNPAVLEEQLTGVDAAYFAQVIQRVKDKDPNRVDAAYLTEIIDRMF